MTHVYAGEFTAAEALIAEGDAITEAIGSAPVAFPSGLLNGWRGIHEPDAWDWGLANHNGGRAGVSVAAAFQGRPAHRSRAVRRGVGQRSEACEFEDFGLIGFSLVELVEAAVRNGVRDEATAALRRLEERTTTAGTDWALGVAARSRALLSEGGRPKPAIARRSSDSSALGSRSTLRAPTSCTGSGSVARTGAAMPASSSGPRTRCSPSSARRGSACGPP